MEQLIRVDITLKAAVVAREWQSVSAKRGAFKSTSQAISELILAGNEYLKVVASITDKVMRDAPPNTVPSHRDEINETDRN